jgi:tartrate-resistant acid phosphatase type 5
MRKIFFVLIIFLVPFILYSQTSVKFASIGDYGSGGSDEAAVADLVLNWHPDFIITVGDNNYPDGDYSTIDPHIGQFYHNYIHPNGGAYGPDTATQNRFFPALGNHDLYTSYGYPYLQYFNLPQNPHNNERYYDYVQGNVHFFVVNSDFGGYEFQGNIWEPDGIDSSSYQAQWIKSRLAASTSRWNIVYFHHPPYNSLVYPYDSIFYKLRWPFKSWGADVVLTGHCHWYERLYVNNFPYIINGLGGEDIGYEDIGPRRDGSQFFYAGNFGAQLIQSYNDSLVFRFYNVNNQLIDYYRIPSLNLRLKLWVEGVYLPNSDSMRTGDTIKVFLRKTTAPYAKVDSVTGFLNAKGLCSAAFNKGQNGTSYYIEVKNKNILETWSKTGQRFTNGFLDYDFTTDPTKAYGNNMALADYSPLRYSFYNGDLNNDGFIDISDQGIVGDAARNYLTGYSPKDLNRDGIVDISDVLIVENNAFFYTGIRRP